MTDVNTSDVLDNRIRKSALVIVAHPDDETLWAGGTIIARPDWHWYIIALSRGSDPDRAPKFFNALAELKAAGDIADLDDEPEQSSLPHNETRQAIVSLLPDNAFDLLFTHGPSGEYTRHRRHEETCRAVADLWAKGTIRAESLLPFAYEDDRGSQLPHTIAAAPLQVPLAQPLWQKKYDIMTALYGFSPDSWEARTTPATEAFWYFHQPQNALGWIDQYGDES